MNDESSEVETKTPATAPSRRRRAGEPPNEPSSELHEKAWDLFARMTANRGNAIDASAVAREAYRRAHLFLEVQGSVDVGEFSAAPPEGPQLADCCAPNLPRNHPLNLVAAVYIDKRDGKKFTGDINRVRKIYDWLRMNPPGKDETEENVAHRLEREFPDLNWKGEHIATAREVFPHYCAN